ncbi:MAG: diguanylate cyclase, partial [Euzebyaceae bacterium]|nr:diguanylate cyclase [Euzebyaceae bacterium]
PGHAARPRPGAGQRADLLCLRLRRARGLWGLEAAARVSIGLATGLTHDAEKLLRLADRALYQAKTAGRDGVGMIEPTAALANP